MTIIIIIQIDIYRFKVTEPKGLEVARWRCCLKSISALPSEVVLRGITKDALHEEGYMQEMRYTLHNGIYITRQQENCGFSTL